MNDRLFLQESAISYGVGSIGSYLYLRMLHRSIDGLGGGIGGALGQPRLLIPLVLTLGYNRYLGPPPPFEASFTARPVAIPSVDVVLACQGQFSPESLEKASSHFALQLYTCADPCGS